MPSSHTNREALLIAASLAPVTQSDIAAELDQMGLRAGDLVLIHTSLSKLGWICGGEQSVLAALRQVLGETGTLVSPGFSSQLSDPAPWSSPPVPADWVQIIRDNMPLFDKYATPTRGMGRLAEAFRHLPDTRRSDHPNDSFLANGPLAAQIIYSHPLENGLGRSSPLGRLHDLNAKILLLGATYRSCTAFHLAEDGLDGAPTETVDYPTAQNSGVTTWTTVRQPQTFEEKFSEIGTALDAAPGIVTTGFNGVARLFQISDAVNCARNWFSQNQPDTL